MKKLKKKIFFGKNSQNAEKKLKGGPFGIFQHPFCRKTSKKMQGGPFGEKISLKNVSQCQKKLKGGLFGIARYGMLRGKTGKTIWSSSMGQMVQFDTIILCRTFKNYFGQFVWIEKKQSL